MDDDKLEELAIRRWNLKTDEAWSDADEYQKEYIREEIRYFQSRASSSPSAAAILKYLESRN